MMTPEELLAKCPELTSLPVVYHKLNEAINSPSCTTGIISRIISHDPILTLKVLKLVNSAFYGFSHEIEDIPQAILIIGLQQLNDLVLANSIIDLFSESKSSSFTLEEFWYHSLATGLLSRILATHVMGRPSDRIFISGLLHVVGKLIMTKAAPVEYAQAIQYSKENVVPMVEAEKKIFGFTHCEVNGTLMKQWRIPKVIEQITSSYTDEDFDEYRAECTLVSMAGALSQSLQIGSCGD
ncbi:MAG: HDOD domain-containing protein, partial [Lentisphaeraceae bacterium]|nr:HDOD domain-containing protein [Lentisphaeraceae bacterium]